MFDAQIINFYAVCEVCCDLYLLCQILCDQCQNQAHQLSVIKSISCFSCWKTLLQKAFDIIEITITSSHIQICYLRDFNCQGHFARRDSEFIRFASGVAETNLLAAMKATPTSTLIHCAMRARMRGRSLAPGCNRHDFYCLLLCNDSVPYFRGCDLRLFIVFFSPSVTSLEKFLDCDMMCLGTH